MAFDIQDASSSGRRLTQSVIQIIQQLDMLNAELARVLHIRCDDIGRLTSAKSIIEEGSTQWHYAEQFVRFYQLLHRYKHGDGVAMRHWLRSQNTLLDDTTPHLLIVDDDRIGLVIEHLEQQLSTE